MDQGLEAAEFNPPSVDACRGKLRKLLKESPMRQPERKISSFLISNHSNHPVPQLQYSQFEII